MLVKEAMHKGVEWVSPDTPIAEVAQIMRKFDIGAVPVGAENRLVGMVTDRDIVCKGLARNGANLEKATAADVMTEGIHTCRAEDELEAAVQHMQELQIRRLPVIDSDKRMVGILSLGDIGYAAPRTVAGECLKHVAAHH